VKIRNALLATASLFAAAASMPAAGAALSIDAAAKLFGARPSASAPDLSPDGDEIVYIEAARGTGNIVRLLNLKTKQGTDVIASAGKPDSIRSCEFASEDWVVCQVVADVPFRAAIVGVSQLVAVNLKTKEAKHLGVDYNRDEAATIRQNDGYVISYPNDGPAAVVMARDYIQSRGHEGTMGRNGPPVWLGVDRIALDTMKVTRIEAPSPLAGSLLTDPDGTARVMETAQYDLMGRLTGIMNFRFRAPGSTQWTDLTTYDSRNKVGAIPLAIDSASNVVYLLRKKNGLQALYRQSLEPNSQPVEVASNPQYDIEGVVSFRRGGPIVGYTYTDDRPETVYFDPAYRSLMSDLAKALPDDPLIDISAVSRDQSKLLVHAAADRDPGAYYLYDRNAHTLGIVGEGRESLAQVPLAPMRRVDVPTADGHTIPAYLTVPPGHAANGPAVVLPHGGPSSRDAYGFDWLAQFLASRGYAVIQPNYRGSAGYGERFLGENAFKNWRTAIADIGASADYLVKQGIADPARLAIVGWSYGGYAALQSAVVTPAKYKAVVAIAPVTDLSGLGRDSENFTSANLTKDFIGKGQNLQDGSPLRHADQIKAPVLLVHGDLDRNVSVSQSVRMEKALRAAGGQVELVEFKDLDHQLEDGDARTEMLTKMGQLLDRTIGH
jgi:dipeptidyl aminopeptidase/acylaminoacyl peptidase